MTPLPGQRQPGPAADDLVVGVGGAGIRNDALLEKGAGIPPRDIHLPEIGHIDHRSDADVVLHQGDIDRELVVALDELHRPVQRVHQPVKLPVAALLVAHLAPLLRKDRNARRPEVLADGPVGQPVGPRDRRAVVLEAYVVVVEVLIDLHDRGSGSHGRIEQGRQQIHSHLVVNHRSAFLGIRSLHCHGKGNNNLSYNEGCGAHILRRSAFGHDPRPGDERGRKRRLPPRVENRAGTPRCEKIPHNVLHIPQKAVYLHSELCFNT